jgi:hypothetical protein
MKRQPCGCKLPNRWATGQRADCPVIELVGSAWRTTPPREFIRERCVLTDDDLAWAHARNEARLGR